MDDRSRQNSNTCYEEHTKFCMEIFLIRILNQIIEKTTELKFR